MYNFKKYFTHPLLLISIVFSFIAVGCGGDWDSNPTSPIPNVASSLPTPATSGVATTVTPSVTFTQAMNAGTINETTFTLTDPDGTQVTGEVVYTGNTATFTPDEELAPATLYTARVTTGAENTVGEPLANDVLWTFETAAAPVIPTVESTIPADEATAVAINTAVTVVFSQAMNPTTLNASNITLVGEDTVEVQGSFVYASADNTLIFTPDMDLAANTLYTATVTTEATNTLGETLAENMVWAFETGATADLTAPEVSLVSPNSAASGVCANKVIAATFTKAMNSTTLVSPAVSFTVMTTDAEMDVAGDVTLNTNKTVATFTPDLALTDATDYTATISIDAEDLAGNALAMNEVWTFTAGTTVCQEPIVLDETSTYGVLSNSGVTLGGGPNSVTGFRVIGDVGIHPAGECVGCDTTTVDGAIAIGNVPAQDAMTELTAIYNEAVGRTTGVCTLNNSGSLVTNPSAACGGGADGIFTPGLYWSASSIAIPAGGTITLDAQNDANAVFIFQSESTIDTIGGDTHIILANQAQAKNVFWVAKSSASIGGTTSDFAGTVMAQVAITVNEGTEMEGRAFARTAAVTVQDNAVITVPAP